MAIAYLNGKYLPLEDAKVSAMDRGYLFGDGIYEIIPVFAGRPFYLAQHLARMRRNLDAIRLDTDLETDNWHKICKHLLEQNPSSPEQGIYLQITRGPAPVRDYSFPVNPQPTVFAYCYPIAPNAIENLTKGITAITLPDIRWQRCDIKAITLLASVLSRQLAKDSGAQEAIFIRDGQALEGTSSNLFIVQDDQLITPPMDHYILGGITRDIVIQLATQQAIPLQEKKIFEDELLQADEIWVTSSTKEILPVINLNGNQIGAGKAGPLWWRMIKCYQAFKASLMKIPPSTPRSKEGP